MLVGWKAKILGKSYVFKLGCLVFKVMGHKIQLSSERL